MSSLIVSQENLKATEKAAAARVLGTCVGIGVAVLVGALTPSFVTTKAVDIGISVAICAAIARGVPNMRVAMWTAPLVDLSQAPGVDLWHAGLWRGLEVVLGAAIGSCFHWISGRAVEWVERPSNI